MKRRAAILSLGVFLVGGLVFSGYGQTAKDVLEKMIEAQGGRKALAAIKDTTISGTIEMPQMNISGSITIYQKEPDRMRMDMEFMGMVVTQAYDGQTAWMVNPQTGGQEVMPEKMTQDFRRQALGNDATLNPEKYGITFALKGKEKIQDKEYLVIEQTYKDGQKATIDIDPVTYLPFKSKGTATDMTGADVEAETFFSDYRKVGDTLAPHAMTVYQNGSEFVRMAFVKIVYNSGLEETLFKMSK